MENKALAGILLMFVGVIVVLSFFNPIASNTAVMTDTFTETKNAQSVPTVATALTGQELISAATVVNESGTVNCANNFTVAEGVDTVSGVKRVIMTPVSTNKSLCSSLNYTYTYGAEGYVDDAGGRGIADNLPLFCALALLGFVLFAWIKSGGLDFLGF